MRGPLNVKLIPKFSIMKPNRIGPFRRPTREPQMCDRPQCFIHGKMCWWDDRWVNCSGHMYLLTYYANMW